MLYGMDYEIILPCSGGYYLCIDGDHLLIVKRKQQEIIPISQIQSFSVKEPGSVFGVGSVTFRTAQSPTGAVSLGLGLSLALGAEKTFSFTREDLDSARQIKEYISNYSAKPSAPPIGKVVSVVDEIRGLKGLLDDGILTQEEFDAQKRTLLNLQASHSL